MESGLIFNQLICEFESRHPCHDIAKVEGLARFYISGFLDRPSIGGNCFSITLATTMIESNRTFTVFIIAVILGYLFGFLFLLLWWKNHTSVSSVVTSIRSRLPPEGKVLSINEAILPTVSIDEPSKSD